MHSKHQSPWPLLLGIALMAMVACNKPILIGSDLLDQDQINTDFTDTLTLKTSITKVDSVRALIPGSTYQQMFCGNFEDPFFGRVEANIYSQFIRTKIPDLEGAVLDSVVLRLAYNTNWIYGDVTQPFTIGVYRITENMDTSQRYYNTTVLATDMTPLGMLTFTPNNIDSVYVEINDSTTVAQPPRVSIPLSAAFGNELITLDSATYATPANFLQVLKGLHIKALDATTGSLLDFDFLSTSTILSVYYKNAPDTVAQRLDYSPLGGLRFTHAKHDFTGSPVAEFLADPSKGDSLLFLQGMGGPFIRVEIPYATEMKNIIVNKAELEFTVVTTDEPQADLKPPLSQAIITKGINIDSLTVIDDVLLSLSRGSLAFFGGGLVEESGGVKRYRFNISSYFQKIVDGTEEPVIFISSLNRMENGARSILYGPRHSVSPAKLLLSFTPIVD